MSFLAALVTYGAMFAGGWAFAGTAGVVAVLVIVVLIERRLAKLRALEAFPPYQETPGARR